MEGEASLARDPNKKLAHDRRRARQRAKREQEINLGVLPAKREDGMPDPTLHVASLDMLTKGRYLELGEGFVIRQ